MYFPSISLNLAKMLPLSTCQNHNTDNILTVNLCRGDSYVSLFHCLAIEKNKSYKILYLINHLSLDVIIYNVYLVIKILNFISKLYIHTKI